MKATQKLGIAVAWDTYERYRALLDSPRWQHILNVGAPPQRLLWASTGAKDPNPSQLLYVQAQAQPFTVNTMPEATLKDLAEHEGFGEALPRNAEAVLAEFAKSDIDTDVLATQLPEKGSSVWRVLELCSRVSSPRAKNSKRLKFEDQKDSGPAVRVVA